MLRISAGILGPVLLVLFAMPSASATVDADQEVRLDFNSASKQLEQFFNQIERLRSSLDRSQIELAAILEAKEFDAGNLIEFVRVHIYFEQYEGSLRGAEGTLRSRAGNALDQSLLLATLLKDAGYDARIKRGRLELADAEALLDSMSAPRARPDPFADEAKYRAALKAMWQLTGEPEDELQRRTMVGDASETQADRFNAVDGETEFILSMLETHQVPLGSDRAYSSLIEEAADYFWVEYTAGTTDWRSTHPAFGHVPSGSPRDLKASQTYREAIPQELQHRFRMEVIVEQRLGEKVNASTVLGPWERPVSNLNDTPLTLANIPLSLASSTLQGSLHVSSEGNDIFVPWFSGGESAKAFDLLGNVVPIEAAQSQFAAMFATDAEKLGSAASALSGLGTLDGVSNAALELAAVKLKFTFILPSGAENSYWRSVYDSDWVSAGTPEAKRREIIYQSLTQNQSFLVVNATPTEAARIDAAFSVLLSKRDALDAVLRRAYGREVTTGTDFDLSWVGLLPTFELFDAYESRLPFRTYRHRPSMVRYRATLPSLGQGTAAVDVVQNKRRITAAHQVDAKESIRALISFGVWESMVEGDLLQSQVAHPTNTVSAFKGFRKHGTDFDVLALGRQNSAIIDLAKESRNALEQDLAQGYVLVLPKPASIPAGMKLHWWRVDPLTGETLGIGSTGEGESLVFYTLQQRLLAGTVIGGVAFVGCVAVGGVVNAEIAPGTVTGGDCVAFGLATGIGAGLGGSVGEGLLAGIGIGAATYFVGKLVDAWGVLE